MYPVYNTCDKIKFLELTLVLVTCSMDGEEIRVQSSTYPILRLFYGTQFVEEGKVRVKSSTHTHNCWFTKWIVICFANLPMTAFEYSHATWERLFCVASWEFMSFSLSVIWQKNKLKSDFFFFWGGGGALKKEPCWNASLFRWKIMAREGKQSDEAKV